MSLLTVLTNWTVGVINGYKQKENGLPNGIKYGTLGVTSFMGMIRVLGNFDTVIKATSSQKLAGLFIVVPVVMGTNFCIGHHLGKAIRYVEDEQPPNRNGGKIQML